MVFKETKNQEYLRGDRATEGVDSEGWCSFNRIDYDPT